MPPIVVHMVLARDVADVLGHEVVDGGRGNYYLGATTPDIRVITRGSRWETHFFDLDKLEHQDSVRELFNAHPHLSKPEHLNDETIAFMAGYITHLTMDEAYITEVYRPFFGEQSALGGGLKANVMDRLLQFDLDRQQRENLDLMMHLHDALRATQEGLQVGFVDGETLEKWRQINIEMTQTAMDWDRTRDMIGRHLRYSGVKDPEELNRFLDELPGMLDETIAVITSERLAGFVEKTAERARDAVARYLGCA